MVQVMPFTKPSGPFGSQSVACTDEVRRIANEAIREEWVDTEEAIQLAEDLTRELKTPNGTMKLRPLQAVALFEMLKVGGGFFPIFVGGGKTLISLIAPLILEAKRPILLLPAALVEKTWHDRRALAEHWHLPTNLQFITYESLSLVQNAKRLDYIQPDLIICDECQFVSAPRSGRSRRLRRYMHDHPDTKFVCMSGTVMKRSIKDFGALLRFALKDKAPVPKTEEELGAWAEALDDGVNPMTRRRPGALMQLDGSTNTDGTIEEARRVFQRRLLRTEGVVASGGVDGVGCPIWVRSLEYEPSSVTVEHFKHIRKLWETPDDWSFMQAVELRMYLRQLSLGFHGIWRPRPPEEWLNARKAWYGFARNVLKNSRTLDTPLAVANAIDARHLDDDGILDRWREVEPTFRINPEPVWHDDTALEAAGKWAEKNKGIVWVEHKFFGEKLAKMLGVPYYGPKGLDATGASIKDAKKGPILASVKACGAGFNLQEHFSANLLTCCPSGALTVEQLIGRTHRPGQNADVVTVDIMLGCYEQMEAFERAQEGAKAAEQTLGHSQKLLLADVAMPDISGRRGPLWEDDGKPCDCTRCK
jgi:hypothetical protein